jgi:aldehyde dehydrogenase (NAD+)
MTTETQKSTTQQPTEWEYSAAPERFPISIDETNKLFIGGKFVSPKSRKWFASSNPATNEKLADIATAGAADVNAAVLAAKKALPKWSKLAGSERAKYLYRIARRIQERAREFAVLETIDGGKPIKESRDIEIFLLLHNTFFTMRGGQISCNTPLPVALCSQLEFVDKLFRGIFRC